jgi:hypothetical protein
LLHLAARDQRELIWTNAEGEVKPTPDAVQCRPGASPSGLCSCQPTGNFKHGQDFNDMLAATPKSTKPNRHEAEQFEPDSLVNDRVGASGRPEEFIARICF